MIQLLLEKISNFERKTSSEYVAMEKENKMLREALQVNMIYYVQYSII